MLSPSILNCCDIRLGNIVGFFSIQLMIIYNDLNVESNMDEKMALGLVKVLKQPQDGEYNEAFDRAYELTKVYAGSANAQASAVPVLFEKLFELFATGYSQSN